MSVGANSDSQETGSWPIGSITPPGSRVKGNVTNRSSHELSGFTLKIVVRDCLALGGSSCTTIGENEVSTHLIVPPNQTRAFEELVTLGDMPEPTKWGWTYAIQEVQGKVK
jgi:hypothetical protein